MLAILIEAAVRSSCLALLLAAALRMARSPNPYIERSVWVAMLCVALLMPLLMLLSRTPVATVIAVPQLAVIRLPARIEHPWLNLAMMCLYGIVCAVLLLRQAIALTRAFAMRRRAVRVQADWTGQLDVRVSEELETPATVGSTILLPPLFITWTEQQRNAVMAHERTHARHHDFAVLCLAHLHRALFWFNPLAWWLPQRLAVLGEHLSDDAALTAMDDRSTYTRLLLAFATRSSLPPSAMAMARASNIPARVQRILSQAAIAARPSVLQRAALMCGVLSATAVAMLATAAGIDQPPRSNRAVPLSHPEYPAAARRQSQQGTVVLELHVLKNGRVDAVQIKRSSGFASLDTAAAQEARQWTLDPAIAAGQPVAAWGEFAVTFELQD